jgi:aspartyl-tRNA(Asn)/glutamyl-tRNA(Gln) amidotransferase subunit A
VSVRIPAAFCGAVGFKPTQYRVPRDGATPLSITLDSVGPLGLSVACCAITDAVMAGEAPVVPPAAEIAGLRLGLPRTSVLDDLDAEVAASFERACRTLSRAGARLVELPLAEFGDYAAINAKGGFSPPEAYAWHAELLARRGGDYDPRVRLRIERGRSMSAADYVTLRRERAQFIARVEARTAEFDALVMPTLPLVAPEIAAFARDEDFWRLNGRILRNTAIINFLDGCALTLPIQEPGRAPVGLMVARSRGGDRRLLAVGRAVEAALAG